MDLTHATLSSSDGPAKFAMHSVEGFGKTTLACHFPNPIIIGAERGVPRDLGFKVAEIHPRSWLDVFDIVGALTQDKHDHKTAVFDTVDWIEPLVHEFVLRRDSERKTEMNPKGNKLLSIEDYGYGKGYLVAEEEFRKLIAAIDAMQARRGIHVALLMHSQTRTFKNPAGPDFDRWEPKCQNRISRVVVEWCENLLFGYFQVDAAKISEDKERNEKSARAKGIGSGIRVVGARQSAMYDAKNRVGLPPELELGEDLTDLIGALVGENVRPHERRAPIREFKQAEAWADRQGAMHRDGNRAAAIEQSTRESDDDAHRRADAERDAADERRAVEQTHADNDRRMRDARDPAPPNGRDAKPSNGALAKANADADRGIRTQRLGEARRLAAGKSDAYLRRVNGWVEKAADDPDKIDAIIAQVGKDLNVRIPA